MATNIGLCVPNTLDCNFHCRYCFRNLERLEEVPAFTDDMIAYVKGLTKDNVWRVVVTGGEPLLHFDKLKEFFSYVSPDVGKQIISNGSLLTEEIVDYLNENRIQLHLSHDGPMTKFLRGIDILDDAKICHLLRKINSLYVTSVNTKYNTDTWENFFYIAKRIGVTTFSYGSVILRTIPSFPDLIEGYDYDNWITTWLQYQCGPFRRRSRNTKKRQFCFDVLPDGTVCGNFKMKSNYGKVWEVDSEEILARSIQAGDMDYCTKTKCKFNHNCRFAWSDADDHMCKCRRLIMENSSPEKVAEVREYVTNHWDEIKEKYGYQET